MDISAAHWHDSLQLVDTSSDTTAQAAGACSRTLPVELNTVDLATELTCPAGKSFSTLGQKRPFDLISVNHSSVVVRLALTDTLRSIPFKQFQAAFDHLRSAGSITLQGTRAYSEMNPVFVAALIAELTGISTSSRPIVLRVQDGDWPALEADKFGRSFITL